MASENTKVVLVGSNGYVGSHLKEVLSKHSIDLYEFNPADVFDSGRYAVALSDFATQIPPSINHVVHLGAVSDSQYSEPDILTPNTICAKMVVDFTRFFQAKLIFFSSAAAIEPKTLYGYSKLIAEGLLDASIKRENLCILRPFNIYGGDESNKDSPSIPWRIQHDPQFKVYKNCVRDFIHVDDVCETVRRLILHEWQPGTYELGTGKPTMVSALYLKLKDEDSVRLQELPDGVPPKLVANPERFLKRFYAHRDVFLNGEQETA